MKQQSHLWTRLHLLLTFSWVLLIIPTLVWWKDSITWVALMSLWANIAAHWSAYQASRVEEKEDTK